VLERGAQSADTSSYKYEEVAVMVCMYLAHLRDQPVTVYACFQVQ
jgi:hypothetical protein